MSHTYREIMNVIIRLGLRATGIQRPPFGCYGFILINIAPAEREQDYHITFSLNWI